jgi:hypothetical protein
MTNITILGGDFEILFDDETVGGNAVAGMRMVRRTSGAGSTVYTSNQLYSAVADEADAFEAMGFRNPMLPVTPNAYTMENQYFLPRSSTEFLKEGTITCDWTNIILPDTNGNGVIRKPYTPSTPFVSGDIGRQVTESAGSVDTGTLLDFEVEPDGTSVLWIRPDVSGAGGDEFTETTGTISVTGDGGTGSGAPLTGETNGITKYTAIQAIGSVPTATEVYIVQDRIKLANAADAGGFQFWTTDTAVSLGIISVLIRTRTADVDIADEDLEVFARRYTSLYDNFRLNVEAGGFSALPLASAPDINNTTGYSAFTGSAGTGPFLVGEIADEAVSLASVVITAVGGTTGDPELEYYIVGDVTIDIFSSGAQTLTSASGTCLTTSPAPNVGGPTEAGAGNGGTVTVTIGHVLADHDGSGITEPYSVTVDAQGPGGNGVAVADVYERIKFITRRGQDNSFWDTIVCSIPGEQYHGIEAQLFTDGETGTFTEGNDITGQLGYTARVLGSNPTAAGEDTVQNYITITDQQTTLDTIVNNDVLTDTDGGDTVVAQFDGAGGTIQNFPSSNKASPFGTFTGTQLFGSRGILFTGQADADGQAYTLIDDNGNQRVSPNTVTFAVENTAEFDRVFVARDTTVDGIIDKDQFGGIAAVAISQTTLVAQGTVDTEVPPIGYIRVVAVDEQQEHKYEYDSRVTGAAGTFTLHPVTPGTTTAGTTDTLLEDSGADFVTDAVVPGMLIHFATVGGSTWEVVSRTDLNTLVISLLYGAGGLADNGEAYTINETIQAYDTSDNFYDLILDTEAVGATTSNTFVQSGNFNTVVNVRQGKIILPFTQNQAVNASGATVTVVRQTDTIAT